jgi:hypothetical protein
MLCFAKGETRARALGFVLVSAVQFALVYLAPARTLAGEFFADMGYVATEGGWYARRTSTFVPGSQAIFNALNAAGTMLTGLIGYGIGALAFRQSHERLTAKQC